MSNQTTALPEGGAAAPRNAVSDWVNRNRGNLGPLLRSNGLLIFFLLLIVVFALIKPQFLSSANLKSVLTSASLVGILACGQTIVMLTGGFDLSVARTAVVAGMLVVTFAALGLIGAVLATLAVGAFIGLVNGTLISRARVNPFVVTLGMYTILGSVALLINNGGSLTDVPSWLVSLTDVEVFGVSGVIIWFAAVAVACHVLLGHTRYGRQVYAVGGNYEASRLAGIRVDKTLTLAYVLTAAIAALAGILLASRLQSASPVALPAAELDAIAAVIIGGTRLGGGFGSIPRTVMGVLILTCLTSGLVILGVAAYWQGVLKGAVIILAVAVDVLFNKQRS